MLTVSRNGWTSRNLAMGIAINLLIRVLYTTFVCLSLYMSVSCMVFVLDGWSLHYAHMRSESRFSICWRHFRTFFSEITCFTSYVHNMFWATILYAYHGFVFDNPFSFNLYIYVMLFLNQTLNIIDILVRYINVSPENLIQTLSRL